MMILYAFPFACSFAVHLYLDQVGHPPELRWVGRVEDRRPTNEALTAANAKRRVPTLVLEDGSVLTEVVSILDYLDQRFHPAVDEVERRRRLEWLAFIATDLHQPVLAPLFDPKTEEASKADLSQRLLPPPLAYVAGHLDGRSTLLDRPSAADTYLFWALLLLNHALPQTVSDPALQRFAAGFLGKPGVSGSICGERAQLKR